MANGKPGAPVGNKNAAGGRGAAAKNFISGFSKGTALRQAGATAGFVNGGRGAVAGATTRGAVGGGIKGAIVGGIAGAIAGGNSGAIAGAVAGAGLGGAFKAAVRNRQAKMSVNYGKDLSKTVSRHNIANAHANIKAFAHSPNSAITQNATRKK